MASIHREVLIHARAETAWSALRDVGAIHQRLAPGFVTDVQLEKDVRTVTFGDGSVVREPILDVCDERKRVAWCAVGTTMTHYNASAQVFAEGPDRCRFVWIADLLPHEAAPFITARIEEGLAAIKRTLEQTEREMGS